MSSPQPRPDTIKFKRKPVKRKLTKRAVESLAAPAPVDGKPQQSWIYDTATPRLAVCTWSSGARSWYWVGRYAGRMLRMKLGSYPEMTPEQARKLAGRVSANVAAGLDPRADRRQARTEMTLGEVFNRYLEDHAKPHKKTWWEDQAVFDRYCGALKARRLSTITKSDIRILHAKVGKRGKYAANRLLALLSKVFAFAADLGFENENPCRGVQRFREQSRDRFLQGDELQRFFEALEGESPDMRDYFKLALFCGARRGNLQAMRWDQLDLDHGLWRVPDTKAGEPQTVYLPAEAVNILRERRETSKSEWVFPSRPGSAAPHVTYQYGAWKRVCKRAGLDNLRPHDLRRSLGSWQAATGATLPVIAKSLGHKNQSTTAIYARLNLDPVRRSVDTAVAAMRQAAGARQQEEDQPHDA